MIRLVVRASVAFVLATCVCGTRAEEQTDGPEVPVAADRVLWNGKIYTFDRPDVRRSVEALAIRGERICFVGSRQAAGQYISDATQVVDLAGQCVLPGFTDAHVHPVLAGLGALECDFSGARSLDAIVATLARYAAEHPDKRWIQGAHLYLPAVLNHPSPRTVLDQVVADRPVYITTDGHHSAFVNTKALELAGVSSESPDPPEGVIGREPGSKQPSGALFESAMQLAAGLLPEYGPAERAEALRRALAELNSLGVTNLVEASGTEEYLRTYLDAASAGNLTAHVNFSIHADISQGLDAVGAALQLRNKYAALGPLPEDVSIDQVKLFLDGTVEEQTAAMLENYRGKEHRGRPRADAETTNLVIAALDRQGVQIHIHAIGDRAVRMALDGLEHAQRIHGKRDSRHHIAHLNVVHPDDIARFGALGVAANFQSLWATVDDPYVGEINRRVLEDEPFAWQYPLGSIFRSGGRLVFGSDWPVSTANPFPAIQVAVTRRGPDAEVREPWTPQHLIDLETVLDGYTREGAWLTFRDAACGALEAGKLADLVVLDRDVFGVPRFELMNVRVVQTLFRGRVVFARDTRRE